MDVRGQTNRIACLMRTHIRDSPKARELAAALARVSGWDFYVLADETNGPVSAYNYAKLSHSVGDCARLGLNTDVYKCFWYFGDYSLYCAYHAIPSYDFYLMWDYDVEVAAASPDYLQQLSDALQARLGSLDMLGSTVGPIDGPRPGRPHEFANPWKAMFAIIGLSRRALITLYEGRLQERWRGAVGNGGVHCEYYVPSRLVERGDFGLAGLNEIIPGSTDRPSFNSNAVRPYGYAHEAPATSHLVHPVVDLHTYLRKLFGARAKEGRVEAFVEQLDALAVQGADPGLLQQHRDHVALHNERLRRSAKPALSADGAGDGVPEPAPAAAASTGAGEAAPEAGAERPRPAGRRTIVVVRKAGLHRAGRPRSGATALTASAPRSGGAPGFLGAAVGAPEKGA